MNIADIFKTGCQISLVAIVVTTIAIFSTYSVEETVPTPQYKPALIASGIAAPVPAKKPVERSAYKSHQIAPASFNMMSIKVSRLFVLEDEELEQDNNDVTAVSHMDEPQNATKVAPVKVSKAKPAAQKTFSSVSREVKKLIRRGRPTEALAYVHNNIAQRPEGRALEYDRMIAHISEGFLYQGQLEEAYALSAEVIERQQLDLPLASWVAGLSLWQMDKAEDAAPLFEKASVSAQSSEMMAASAAYWAARAYGKSGQTEEQERLLQRAALFSETFYGLLAMQSLGQTEALSWDDADYPVAQWAPKDGYRLDPSLLNAIIRQESYFKPNAKSYSGARGLMQVMPSTAQYIAKIKGYGDQLSMDDLTNPEMSMKLGQDYVEYLFKHRGVDGDMVSMLVAYNAGPGNLLKWRGRIRGQENDPLLLIEMLPVEETRDYVEKVMANYWIYRMRDGQNSPSLASLAQGRYHKYAAAHTYDELEDQPITVASN